jgi:hypothetical protein
MRNAIARPCILIQKDIGERDRQHDRAEEHEDRNERGFFYLAEHERWRAAATSRGRRAANRLLGD